MESAPAPDAPVCVNPYTDCCRLVNDKKEAFYNVPRNLSSFQTKYPQFKTKFFTDNFDWSDRDGCCNVIAISLYFLNCNIDALEKYLLSIQRSIKNIETNLPDWVIRLYFSSSVFHCMEEGPHVSNEQYSHVREAYEFICSHEQVELYRYEESIFGGLPIEHSRTLRFLPLIDPEVNVCNVREADGIVTLLDCHNMKFFAESTDHLFYLPDHGEINRLNPSNPGLKQKQLFSSYAGWLTIYKSILNRDYFFVRQNVYDLVAGLFGTKIKPKPEHYTRTIQNLKDIIRSFEEFHTLYQATNAEYMRTHEKPPSFDDIIGIIESVRPELIEFTRIFKPPKIHATITMSYGGYYEFTPEKFITQFIKQQFKRALEIGFDEIFLLDLFKDFISVNVTHTSKILYSDVAIGEIRNTRETSGSIVNLQQYIISDNIDNFDVHISESISMNNLQVLIETLRRNLSSSIGPVHLTNQHQYTKKSLDEFNFRRSNTYEFLYVIDSLLTNIEYNKAFNITILLNRGFGEKVRFKLNEILNVPYLSRYDFLYDSPLKSSSGAEGGSKRHNNYNTSFIKQMTNRRRRRLYRSRKKSQQRKTSQKRRHKKTYKYKN